MTHGEGERFSCRGTNAEMETFNAERSMAEGLLGARRYGGVASEAASKLAPCREWSDGSLGARRY